MPPDAPFRILLIEDDDEDAELVADHVRTLGGDEFVLERVAALLPALELIRGGGFDIVLLDLGLPDSTSRIDTLRAICDLCHDDRPLVVVLTGLDDQELAREAIMDCAQEFLIKDEVTARNLLRTLRLAVQQHGRRRVEEIQGKAAVTPADVDDAQQILRRANRVVAAADAHDDAAAVRGGLTTASRAVEITLGDVSRKLDTILIEQRRLRGDVTELTVQSRKTTAENHGRDLEQVKIRDALVSLRRQFLPINRMISGAGDHPPLATRLDALESLDRNLRHREESRKKTIREIMVALLPPLLLAVGGAIVSAVAWYLTQTARK